MVNTKFNILNDYQQDIVQASSEVHPASYTIGTGCKAAGAWR